MVQDLLRQDARTQDLYFNISELKQSQRCILCMIPFDIILTKNSDVIDLFHFRDISTILDPCILAQKILDREIHTLKNDLVIMR